MGLFFRFIVSCVLMVGVGSPAVWAQTDIGTLKKGVVKIISKFSHGEKIGTGFIAAKSKKHLYIVTASHVVEGETEAPTSILVTFFTHQEEAFKAKIVKMEGDNPRGMALLKVKGDVPEDIQILSWDLTTQVHGGEEIHLIGFPRIGGNPWAVTKGTLSGFDGPVLKFSGAVAEGNSGGPVLYQGRVVGVVMEVTGQFGNAKPAQIAKFTVENWPGYPRQLAQVVPTPSLSPILPSGMATLVIETIPSDAQVYVDDAYVGQTAKGPLVMRDVEPDDYDLRVKKDGFRSWSRSITVKFGEERTVRATLKPGEALGISGVWKNPSEPAISYVLQQQGKQVTMVEVTTSILGNVVTAQGEGQLVSNQLEIMYRTAAGTMGQSTTTLSADGQQLVGNFQDFSTMIPVAISLTRASESPSAFLQSGSVDFNALQNFGQ